jgi:hypothetical protein
MGYYIRVLSTSPTKVPFESLVRELQSSGLQGDLTIDDGDAEDWEQLLLRHSDGREIATLEHCAVEEDSLAAEELEEFSEELADGKPASAAKWLLGYFPKVQRIYTFQVLSGVDHLNGWEIMGVLQDYLFSSAPSINQADGEGFTNEDGYHILWQFSDHVTDSWRMAVLEDGQWRRFEMDLGNPAHRAAFFEGKFPEGVRPA